MIRDRVSPIRFASLLVTIPMVLGVLANGYIQKDDGYYGQENHSSDSDDENNIEDHHKSAGYSYQYQVHSPHTGDYKTQHEERIGDTVRGSYSLIEPDGMRRIVEYTADPLHGFKAVVKREPTNMHLQHQPQSHPHQLQPQPQYQHHSPQLIQPMPITRPPFVLRPTPPTKVPQPVRMKYPPKLFFTTPQPVYPQPVYYETASTSAPKVRYTPKKYSFFRWPFMY